MTKALPFTQASLRRAIAAARAAGLRITGIRSDGTLLVQDRDDPQADRSAADEDDKWADVRA
jgi:hypothetical protein